MIEVGHFEVDHDGILTLCVMNEAGGRHGHTNHMHMSFPGAHLNDHMRDAIKAFRQACVVTVEEELLRLAPRVEVPETIPYREIPCRICDVPVLVPEGTNPQRVKCEECGS